MCPEINVRSYRVFCRIDILISSVMLSCDGGDKLQSTSTFQWKHEWLLLINDKLFVFNRLREQSKISSDIRRQFSTLTRYWNRAKEKQIAREQFSAKLHPRRSIALNVGAIEELLWHYDAEDELPTTTTTMMLMWWWRGRRCPSDCGGNDSTRWVKVAMTMMMTNGDGDVDGASR